MKVSFNSMVSCKIYKLNPNKIIEFDKIMKNLIEKKEEGIEYDSIDYKGEEIPLFLYVVEEKENEFGVEYTVVIDDYFYSWNFKEGRFPVKISKTFHVQIYRKNLENFLSVFAPREYAIKFVDIINGLLLEEKMIWFVSFDLDGKKEEIKQKFPEIRRFSAEKIKNDHVKRASVGGTRLGDSQAWQRYIETLDGMLRGIIIKYKEIYISISSDGVIFGRSKLFNEHKEEIVYEILQDLLQIGAVKVIEG